MAMTMIQARAGASTIDLPRYVVALVLAAAVGCSQAPPAREDTAPATTSPAVPAFQPTIENTAPAPGPAPEGMVWIPGGEFSMGAQDPPDMDERRHAGHDRLAAHPSRVRGRLLDGPDRGHQRAVRGIRQRDRLRHGRRAQAARRRLSRRAPREPGRRLGRLHAAAISRCRSTTTFNGGRTCKGANWRHPARPDERSAARETATRSCTSPTRMPSPTRRGRASGCRRKPSGSSPRAAACGQAYPWGDEFRPGAASGMANTYQGHFPDHGHRRRRLRRHRRRSASSPPTAMACTTWPATSGSGAATGIGPTTTPSCSRHGGVARNPQGPTSSFDPAEPGVHEARPPRRLVPLHRRVLLPLHGRHARQGRRRHRHQPPRLPPGTLAGAHRRLNGRITAASQCWETSGPGQL